jgi:hypothetical protein
MMLPGFRSRWMMPAACARLSASAISTPYFSASPSFSPLRPDQLAQRLALDVFHGDIVNAVLLIDVVYVNDVGMIQGRGRLSFLDKSSFAFGVSDLLRRKDLQGNRTGEVSIPGLVDHSHPALAQLVEDLVVRDGPPGHRKFSISIRSVPVDSGAVPL